MAYVRVCKIGDVPRGTGLRIDAGSEPIALFAVGGELFAVDDTCTHHDWSLCYGHLEGEEIVCSLHLARFSLRTGAVMAPPATRGLRAYPVRVEGDDVLIDLEAGTRGLW